MSAPVYFWNNNTTISAFRPNYPNSTPFSFDPQTIAQSGQQYQQDISYTSPMLQTSMTGNMPFIRPPNHSQSLFPPNGGYFSSPTSPLSFSNQENQTLPEHSLQSLGRHRTSL